jgi:soluble lytic murein transglycosylase-like protein
VRSESPRPSLTLVVAACVLGLPVLLGWAQQVLPAASAAYELQAGGGQAFRTAAAAMRRHDCSAALADLAPLLAAQGPDTTLAGLVSGFYAHACEQVTLAEERLFGARMPGGLFEDWRLLLLADSARARGHVLVAKVALAKLLGDYPASPLRPRALARAAALDWERADAEGALALVRQARREGLHGDERTRLDALAWDIGTRLNDPKVRAEAARELLVTSPVVAAQLTAAEVFRGPDGTLAWTSFLSTAQLRQRAQALLALQLEPGALATLDAVAPDDRDLQWVLLKAEALTRAHRGSDALALLRPLQTSDPHGRLTRAEREMQPLFKGAQLAALEWALAQASDDAAAAYRGRSARAKAEWRKLRLAARLHLRSAAELGADPELSARAFRALFAHLIEEDLFEPAVEALRRLRALDPKDTTGANFLWARGWQDFSRRNYTGAIGYWTELTSLYPDDSSGRRARYWIARSCEALGRRDRARQLYDELAAADTSDFYRRYAVARLARWKAVPPESGAQPAEPWPFDPALARTQLLSDFGLDDLAQSELELVRDRAQPRSVAALQALILARRGDRRKSVLAIREAFPALGGPLQAAVPEEALKLYYPLDYEQPIRASARANGLLPALVFGVIRQESAFDANALSWAGACGLMQLMPGTARELARGLGLGWSRERLSDPAWNVQVGTSYLRQVLAMFGGNVELALAGYNGGPFRIKRLWRESKGSDLDSFLEGLSIEESKVYVKRILVLSDSYRRLYPHAAG